MKVAHGQSICPAKSLHDLFAGTYTLNKNDPNALTIAPARTKSITPILTCESHLFQP